MENKKQILSMQLNVDDFAPASDSEKESLSVMRESVSFWKDGLRRLRKKMCIRDRVTLVIVSMLTFFLMFLVPGGPFLSEKSPSPAVLAAMEEKYGLDKPVIVQYKNYMLNLLQGELGPSIKQRGRTVAQIIGSRFPVSAHIGGIALAIAVVVGVVLGSVAALNRGKWIDNVIIVIATCGIAVPSFVVCTILLYIFSLKLGRCV